jgi:ribA/ribD-fused uncharacterized protein
LFGIVCAEPIPIFSEKMKPEDARSINDLTTIVGSGMRPEFVFFWGHTPKAQGQVDQSCLSNWFSAKFSVAGIEYPTTEHFMMAEKARLFGDEAIRTQIFEAGSPDEAKSLGRKVSGFDDATWREHRFGIVVTGNHAKFAQNSELGDFLRNTGSKVLVEASPYDRIWGIGMRKDNEHVENPLLWNGLNLLGFALMEVRHRLTQES